MLNPELDICKVCVTLQPGNNTSRTSYSFFIHPSLEVIELETRMVYVAELWGGDFKESGLGWQEMGVDWGTERVR